MSEVQPNTINPSEAIKTHVSEMSPAQRLAAHDAAARQANAALPEYKEGEKQALPVTIPNLVEVTLDVVKDFARQGFDPSTVTAELAVEKVLQRFPNGVTLIGAESPAKAPEADILRSDMIADEDAGNGLSEGGNPIGSPEAAEEINAANDADGEVNGDERPKPPAKKAAKKSPAKKAGKRRAPAGPPISPTAKS